jgi:hypothetical protein
MGTDLESVLERAVDAWVETLVQKGRWELMGGPESREVHLVLFRARRASTFETGSGTSWLIRQALVFTLLLGLTAPALAQETPDPDRAEFLDVVTMKDGTVWRGVIVEQVPRKELKIALSGGSVVVVSARNVVSIAKEKNPKYEAPKPMPASPSPPAELDDEPEPPAQPTDVDEEFESMEEPAQPANSVPEFVPPPASASGPPWRIGGGVGLVFPQGELDDSGVVNRSVLVTGRIGKEVYRDSSISVVPAARANVIYWRLPDGAGDASLYHIHLGGEVRVAGDAGDSVLWASAGLGLDYNVFDVPGLDVDGGTGLGLNVQVGVDFRVSPGFLLGVGAAWHPGFSPMADADDAPDAKYAAIVVNMTAIP